MSSPSFRLAPEQIHHALDEDARRVLRIGPFVFGPLLLAEAASHIGSGPPVHIAFPSVAAFVVLAVGVLARWRRSLSPAWAWLLLPWSLLLVAVLLHTLREDWVGTMAFLSMMLITSGALFMPTRAMLVAVFGTWLPLVHAALREGWASPTAEVAVASFSLPVALLVYGARRSALLAQESQRALEHALRAETERVARMERLAAMAGGVAHHFNNLLTASLGGIELAEWKLPADHEARKPLAEARESSERLAALTRQLAAFAGDSATPRERLRPRDWIDEEALRQELPEGIELRVVLADEPQPVLGDAHQLAQALAGLVRNAGEASRPGGRVDVRVSVEPSIPGTRVEVVDSGAGIAPQDRTRVLEPFYSTREPTRAGLGLPLAHGVFQAHGGTMILESLESGGTRVRVVLPSAPRGDVTPTG